MSKNFQKALQRQAGENQPRANRVSAEKLSDEEIREEAFKSRRNREANIPQKMADDNTRHNLLRQAGFDYIDIEELTPHPDNKYHFDEQDIELLAGLIYNSKETQPLVVRETEDGLQIIDGERRWHAHKLLAKLYGDLYRMVPVRCHPLGSLSESEVMRILHSNNAGQRQQTPSERAMGYAYLADNIMEWRKTNPELKGVKTKDALAEHFGVSPRKAQTNLNIGKNLVDSCKELLDDRALTLAQAEEISRFEEDVQEVLAKIIVENGFSKEAVDVLIEKAQEENFLGSLEEAEEEATAPKRKAKDINGYLKSAKNALRKASRSATPVNYKLLGEVKQLIRDIEQIQNELETRNTLSE